MNQKKIMLVAIILITIASIVAIVKLPTKLGLDLIGGSRLVLEAQTTDDIRTITPEIMDSLQFAIEKRVNALGVAETVVQKAGDRRLVVEIPNVSDPKQAKQFLGETAELEFKELKAQPDGSKVWVGTGLSGKDLKKAQVSNGASGAEWVVSLEFSDAGAKKFADLTTRLVGQEMAIFFNNEFQSAPRINEPILGGQAQISGGGKQGFSFKESKEMVDLLNAGALPVPAKIIEENSVGPTLGLDSLNKSKKAGFIGLGLVILFMIAYYRLPGIIASIALVIYGLMSLAIFKIIPVTLTLAGIAGFILSIGMAVDANILIFERTKEELKMGKTFYSAINAGFDRAFTSIFDSNMTTLITCAILYMLGSSIVRGFALTLAIGVLLSMFSAITITKNFMHVFFDHFDLDHPSLFGLKESDIQTAYKAENTTADKAKYGVLD